MVVQWYTSTDGKIHAPDTLVGSDLDYEIDWATLYLANENDTFVSMSWDNLPAGLTLTESADTGGVSRLQIKAVTVGDYVISGFMTSEEAAHQQVMPIEFHLKVE